MKYIFTMHKANTVTITYANTLFLGMKQIKNSKLWKNKEMNSKFEEIQNLVA